MNKKTLATMVVALSLVLMGAGCSSQATVSKNETIKDGYGKVVVSITDAAKNIFDVTELALTENKVELHSTTDGWITVSTDTKTFKVMELKALNKLALVAMVDVLPGRYDQLRMSVVSIKVTTKDGVTTEAKLPSNKLTFKTAITVSSGATSSISMDFLADASLHVTGNGKFIFTPVVKIENRSNATVLVADDDSVDIENGTVEENITHGMDLDGDMKSDFKLGNDRELDIDDDGKVTTTIKTKKL